MPSTYQIGRCNTSGETLVLVQLFQKQKTSRCFCSPLIAFGAQGRVVPRYVAQVNVVTESAGKRTSVSMPPSRRRTSRCASALVRTATVLPFGFRQAICETPGRSPEDSMRRAPRRIAREKWAKAQYCPLRVISPALDSTVITPLHWNGPMFGLPASSSAIFQAMKHRDQLQRTPIMVEAQ